MSDTNVIGNLQDLRLFKQNTFKKFFFYKNLL